MQCAQPYYGDCGSTMVPVIGGRDSCTSSFYPDFFCFNNPLATLAFTAVAAAEEMERKASLSSSSATSASDESHSNERLNTDNGSSAAQDDLAIKVSLSTIRSNSTDSTGTLKTKRLREIQCPRPGCGRLYSSENSLR